MRMILISIGIQYYNTGYFKMKIPNLFLVVLFSLFITNSYVNSTENTTLKANTLLTPQQALGKRLFFDTELSAPTGLACASCHHPDAGFALPQQHSLMPVSAGAIKHRFGNRNTPTIRYASFIPRLHFDKKEKLYIGGLFLDGRENSLESQASGPLFNPLEMAVPNKEVLLKKLKAAKYADDFKKTYGKNGLMNAEKALIQVTLALAAYQRSKELSPFSSKYDLYLQGKVQLTKAERRGLKLYESEDKGNCVACHPNQSSQDKNVPPLFTDFSYDNLGAPANLNNPYYSQAEEFNPTGKYYIDLGLGAIVKDKKQNGKFRVPTLRNIAITAPYMHNGVFKTLKEVVNFYNTRDTKKWPKPEVDENINKDEMGDLKLTEQDVDDIIAFMKTLTDGYKISMIKKK